MTRRLAVLALVLLASASQAAGSGEVSLAREVPEDPRAADGTVPAASLATGAVDGATGFDTGPAQSLVASAAYPGLGQLLNETERKAAVVGGVEAFLIARLLLEDRWTRHSQRLYNETGKSRYFDEYSRHFDTRQTLLWWVVVAALYGIADAYVDAHLVGFDDLRPALPDDWSVVPGGDDVAFRIGFACRF